MFSLSNVCIEVSNEFGIDSQPFVFDRLVTTWWTSPPFRFVNKLGLSVFRRNLRR